MTCAICGQENPAGSRFCSACGAALVEGAPAAPSRKTVTVVFADVAGSTALGERLDPESLRRVMGRYFDEMRTVVERHGGIVEKFIGDAIMAVFGIPVVHEDDALRAVSAATEMRGRLGTLNQELGRDYGARLDVRIGVNTGEVVTGELTGQRLATGDAVNVAARLEQAARPDEILIGEATRRLVRDAVEAEEVEPLELKGKAEPVAAFRVVGVTGRASRERRLASPLVGRRRELALLRQAFDRATGDRACQLFTVLGAAGVGKSRLVGELLASLSSDARVLAGRCLPYGEGITFWPLVEIYQQADASGELEEALRSASPEETFMTVRKFFETLAREQPLVVILDDVHWAEPRFLDLIEHVADLSRDAPILLACLARPELFDARPAWGGGKLNATAILLEPLEEDESRELLANLLEAETLDPAVRARIVEAAEGNPLFVEEMATMVAERPEGGRIDVPPSIHAVLAARLDQLAVPERELVGRAAVEGRVFHRGSVVELSAPEQRPAVSDVLSRLVRKELIRPHDPEFAAEDAYRFRHLLLRDAAYESLSKESRAELHERFAAWLERAAGERASDYEEIVAYHLEQAYRHRADLGPLDDSAQRLAREAARRLAAAGERALRRSDVPAAVNLLTRARELLPPGAADRVALLPDLGAALKSAGSFAEADTVLLEAIESAPSVGDRPVELRARLLRAQLLLHADPQGSVPPAGATATEALAELEELGDDRALVDAWMTLSEVSNNTGRWDDLAEYGEMALDHARRAGDRRQESEAIMWVVAGHHFGPRPVAAGIRRCEAIIRDARGNPAIAASARIHLGVLRAKAGDFAGGRALLLEGSRMTRELGMRLRAATSQMAYGWLGELDGDLEAAEAAMRAGATDLEEMGEQGYRSTLAAVLAENLYRQGLLDEAEEWTRVSEEAAAPDDLMSQVGWRSVRAKVLVDREALVRAEALALEAVRLARATDSPELSAQALLALATVLRAGGRETEAVIHVEEAIELLRAKGATVAADQARDFLAGLARPSPSP